MKKTAKERYINAFEKIYKQREANPDTRTVWAWVSPNDIAEHERVLVDTAKKNLRALRDNGELICKDGKYRKVTRNGWRMTNDFWLKKPSKK